MYLTDAVMRRHNRIAADAVTLTIAQRLPPRYHGVYAGFLGGIYLDWRHTRRQRRSHILAFTASFG